jgi:prevent-host-death family protein
MSDLMSYNCGVKRVGLRELNQHPSRVIDLVKHGETVEITERGRPVARVVPLTAGSDLLDKLVREGRVVAPTKKRGPFPMPPVSGDPNWSAAADIEAARSRERW